MNDQSKNFAHLLALAALRIKAIKLSPDDPYTWAAGWRSPIYNDNRLHLSYPDNRTLIIDALVDKIKSEGITFDGILGTSTSGIPWATLLADKLMVPLYTLEDGKAIGHPRPAALSAHWSSDIVAASAPRGLPSGIRVAHMTNLPFIYVRPAKKQHGLQNQIEGSYEEGQTVCYVTSSDAASADNKKALTEAGLTIKVIYPEATECLQDVTITSLKLLVIEDLISTAGSSMKEAELARKLGAIVKDIITLFNYGFPAGVQKATEANVIVHSLCTYANVLEAAKEEQLISEENLIMLADWSSDPEQWSDEHCGTTFKEKTSVN